MSSVTIKMVLTGPRAGKTCKLGKRQFTNGVHWLKGDPLNLQYAVRALARGYQAYPEGSEELRKAQERDNGVSGEVSEAPGSCGPETVQSGNDEAGQGSAELRNDAGEQSTEAAGTDPVDGQSPDGSGLQGAGSDQVTSSENPKLMAALLALDPDNEEHWRTDGKPMMSAVEQLYNAGDVTRDDIEAVKPGWNRDKAREESEKKAAEDLV